MVLVSFDSFSSNTEKSSVHKCCYKNLDKIARNQSCSWDGTLPQPLGILPSCAAERDGRKGKVAGSITVTFYTHRLCSTQWERGAWKQTASRKGSSLWKAGVCFLPHEWAEYRSTQPRAQAGEPKPTAKLLSEQPELRVWMAGRMGHQLWRRAHLTSKNYFGKITKKTARTPTTKTKALTAT